MCKDLRSENHEIIEESVNYIAAANIKKKEADGTPYYVLSSTNVTLLNRSVCTIVFVDPEKKEWAMRVWRSLRHPNAQANPTCIGTGE